MWLVKENPMLKVKLQRTLFGIKEGRVLIYYYLFEFHLQHLIASKTPTVSEITPWHVHTCTHIMQLLKSWHTVALLTLTWIIRTPSGLDPSLPEVTVSTKNELRGNSEGSFVRSVTVEMLGHRISIPRDDRGVILVGLTSERRLCYIVLSHHVRLTDLTWNYTEGIYIAANEISPRIKYCSRTNSFTASYKGRHVF